MRNFDTLQETRHFMANEDEAAIKRPVIRQRLLRWVNSIYFKEE